MLALDEFDRIDDAVRDSRADGRIFGMVRELIEQHPRVVLALSGNYTLAESDRRWREALKSVRTLPVTFLPPFDSFASSGVGARSARRTEQGVTDPMKIFTLITVICLPMTLLASIVGMNVYMPLADHPLALPILLLIMAALAAAMLAFFRRKHWV